MNEAGASGLNKTQKYLLNLAKSKSGANIFNKEYNKTLAQMEEDTTSDENDDDGDCDDGDCDDDAYNAPRSEPTHAKDNDCEGEAGPEPKVRGRKRHLAIKDRGGSKKKKGVTEREWLRNMRAIYQENLFLGDTCEPGGNLDPQKYEMKREDESSFGIYEQCRFTNEFHQTQSEGCTLVDGIHTFYRIPYTVTSRNIVHNVDKICFGELELGHDLRSRHLMLRHRDFPPDALSLSQMFDIQANELRGKTPPQQLEILRSKPCLLIFKAIFNLSDAIMERVDYRLALAPHLMFDVFGISNGSTSTLYYFRPVVMVPRDKDYYLAIRENVVRYFSMIGNAIINARANISSAVLKNKRVCCLEDHLLSKSHLQQLTCTRRDPTSTHICIDYTHRCWSQYRQDFKLRSQSVQNRDEREPAEFKRRREMGNRHTLYHECFVTDDVYYGFSPFFRNRKMHLLLCAPTEFINEQWYRELYTSFDLGSAAEFV